MAAALLDLVGTRSAASPRAGANAFILGRVPDIAEGGTRRVDCASYRDTHPDSDFAQAIDRLAAKIAGPAPADARAPDAPARKPGRVFVLAPLSSREGATSLALCIASAAGQGRRILLIDADQARRSLSKRLAVQASPGLSDVIGGDISANKAALPNERFVVLAAGQKPLDPTASGKALRAFLTEARARFDLVLIDAPAFDTGPDALAFGSLADGIALVACWEQLLREDFITAVDAIADKPNFAGIILNRVAARGGSEAVSIAS